MAAAPVLADPSAMTPGERTNELVALVQRDDLLGVLLVLLYCGEAEVNSTATLYRTSPVEAALLYPTRRTPVRRLIAECLLHRGARTDHLAQNMPSRALPAIESILSSWDDGGRERATISYDLSFTMDLYAAEEYLQEHGYGPDGPPDPPSADSSSAPAVLAPVSHAAPTPPTPPHDDPHRPVDSPSSTLYELVPQDAATPYRRDGPSDHAPSPRDDSRRSEHAQWPSRGGSDRHEPRRRSRSPYRRRDSYARDDCEQRSRSPRRERPSSPRRVAAYPRNSSPPRHDVGDGRRRGSKSLRGYSPTRSPTRERERAPARSFENADRTSRRRSRSRSRSPHEPVPRGFTPEPRELENWLFVGGLPQTVAERFIYDHLSGVGIRVDDVFLSQSHHQPTRFAYVAVGRAQDISPACASLRNLTLDGRRIFAKPFTDASTGSSVPEVSNSEYKRQYVGSERQAQRSPDQRKLGLFLLHLSRNARPADVVDFLGRSLRADEIGPVEVKQVGMNVIAFVSMRDEALCRRVIRQLDGECFCGQAVRVAWRELDTHESRSRRVQGPASQHSHELDGAAVNREPLKINRYDQLAKAGAEKQNDPQARSAPLAAADVAAPAIQSHSPSRSGLVAASAPAPEHSAAGSASPSSTLVGSRAAPPGAPQATPAPPSSVDRDPDVDRLRSIGLSDEQVAAVQQLWRPVERDEVGGPTLERRMDVQVDFGCVFKEDARLALAQNAREPAFPDDSASQARYSAFLEAQAGESRDYYTVFFAKLAEFSSSSVALAAKARSVAEAARRDMGASMDVGDGSGVKE
ncbi:uncharacterized protein RHOBADRAFT_53030 [Rhodotorula graminis WP1]|uniref:RRM domain-containing protein n=1 Tax=Rhodotorula graminis (strain WP1) TaxID=578459 RepID=A0A194S6A8_RHOGW|nr:uncharacterized protein RHOBADRAFT_53030 [Rhodotorula graminis WP1]KPV76030.1 hypothetical protein RHOBADRAFT_53030 [Rhodotorula graminis WP1]